MNQSYCIEFYNVLVGSNISLNVCTENSTGTKRPIFARNYDHGVMCSKGEAAVTTVNQFQLIFEVTSGYFRQGKSDIRLLKRNILRDFRFCCI